MWLLSIHFLLNPTDKGVDVTGWHYKRWSRALIFPPKKLTEYWWKSNSKKIYYIVNYIHFVISTNTSWFAGFLFHRILVLVGFLIPRIFLIKKYYRNIAALPIYSIYYIKGRHFVKLVKIFISYSFNQLLLNNIIQHNLLKYSMTDNLPLT